MHHADGAWSRVHNIDFDPDTLERDMADLRNHVQSLSHEQAAVNLVLHQDQIKFLVLDHDLDQADDQITKVIAHELEQNTPYLISELRYDYKILDNKVHVAAVALETLQEVEEFVTTHGFDVIGSRAAEQMGGFENGAYFGRASDHAGRSVRPAIADIPNTTITPSPTQSPAVPPAAEQTTAPAPQPAPAPGAESVTDTAKKTAPASANLVAAPMPTKPTPVINAAAAPSVPSKSEAAATIVAQKLAAISVERAAKTPPSARATPAKEKQTYIALAVGLAVILLLGLGWWMAGPADTPDTDTAQTETIPTDATQIDANQPERIEQISLSDPAATPDTDLGATADPAVPSEDTGDTLGVQTPPQTPAGTTEQTNTVTYSDQDVQRIYAATGIWVRGPDSEPAKWPEPLGDIYIASIDRVIELQDAVALPSPQSYQTDTGIRTPAVPAPAGTIFELNALGLIQATAQGALAPEGYTVFLGRPSVTPPENPQADIEPVLNDARSLLTTNGTPLIDLRPRPRPALSVLEAHAQQQTDALALLRPKTRPDTISALSEAMATPAPDTGLTAVPTPKIRPNALQTTVLSPEEAEGDEAAVTSAAPRIPSNAKVAEEATIQNALKLNDLNLIGVYGSGSSKRALVRFANGKRQMVSVGDRLDGGKVAAIGDTELRYVKGGRNVVLKLPRG